MEMSWSQKIVTELHTKPKIYKYKMDVKEKRSCTVFNSNKIYNAGV